MSQYIENRTVTFCAGLLVRTLPRLNGKLRVQLNSVWLLLFLSFVPEISPAAGTIDFYTPKPVGNISGRAYADGDAPVHWLNMSTFGQTSSAVAQTISGWNVGDFTGVESPTPVGEYQLGIGNGSYRSSAVQMTDTTVGSSGLMRPIEVI